MRPRPRFDRARVGLKNAVEFACRCPARGAFCERGAPFAFWMWVRRPSPLGGAQRGRLAWRPAIRSALVCHSGWRDRAADAAGAVFGSRVFRDSGQPAENPRTCRSTVLPRPRLQVQSFGVARFALSVATRYKTMRIGAFPAQKCPVSYFFRVRGRCRFPLRARSTVLTFTPASAAIC